MHLLCSPCMLSQTWTYVSCAVNFLSVKTRIGSYLWKVRVAEYEKLEMPMRENWTRGNESTTFFLWMRDKDHNARDSMRFDLAGRTHACSKWVHREHVCSWRVRVNIPRKRVLCDEATSRHPLWNAFEFFIHSSYLSCVRVTCVYHLYFIVSKRIHLPRNGRLNLSRMKLTNERSFTKYDKLAI